MNKVLNMTYTSSLTDLCEINSSFDRGVLRICYTGKNRNGSYLSREVIEKCIPTIYNCPIVCNYDRETDSLGGHDIEVVPDDSGKLFIVNKTQPVGIIPESARVWFDNYTEEDGTEHEYLYADVLLWKRQEAYRKIKDDGVTAQSMEITVEDGENKEGTYYINDFEFTAFALIGIEPCFESAALEIALETFSKTDFKAQLSEMMKDLKETFATKEVNSSTEGDHIKAKHIITEGGMRALDDKIALVAEYGFDVDSLGFSIEDISVENLRAELEKLKAAKDAPQTEDKFALTSNIIAELEKAIGEEKIAGEWWDEDRRRYQYVDSDFDLCEVYCWDAVDWLLYGFTYAVTGDSVVVDFTSRKRKKWAVTDFNDGEEQASPFGNVFQNMTDKLHELSEKAAGFSAAEAKINSLEEELGALRSFKTDTESNIARSAREAVFSKFEDLAGIEAFETLKMNCESYSADELEEKCYAIRGRNGTASAKFALNNGTPKLKVDKSGDIDEPYGGIFLEFNVKDEMN